MRLENMSKRKYQHSYLDKNKHIVILELAPGQNKEIPDNIAKQWLKTGEVREYADPKEAQAKEEKLKAENEALKKELQALKEKENKKASKPDKAKAKNK